MTTITAGIDVSKHTLHLHMNGQHSVVANQAEGVEKAAHLLRVHSTSPKSSWRPQDACTQVCFGLCMTKAFRSA